METIGTPADASSVIYLAKANGIGPATRCLGPLLITPSVWIEVIEFGERRGATDVDVVHAGLASGFIRRMSLDPKQADRARRIENEFGLGIGESEVLAVADPYRFVLLDERRATRTAHALGLVTVGTISIPAICARAGVLDQSAALDLLESIARYKTLPSELMLNARALLREVFK